MNVRFSLQVLNATLKKIRDSSNFNVSSYKKKKLYLYKTYLHDVVAILCLLNAC
jgi:hypothetical protein